MRAATVAAPSVSFPAWFRRRTCLQLYAGLAWMARAGASRGGQWILNHVRAGACLLVLRRSRRGPLSRSLTIEVDYVVRSPSHPPREGCMLSWRRQVP